MRSGFVFTMKRMMRRGWGGGGGAGTLSYFEP